VVAHAVGIDPTQLHGESPFNVFSTPPHQGLPLPARAPNITEQL
jgi:hypothetical protein